MLEVVLDTETTGLSTKENHRIVEIGCVELNDQIATGNVFHTYINPQRQVSEDAYKVHGYSDKFLADKKTFPEIADSFLNFIKGKKLIIHNAEFDLSFINYELRILRKKTIDKKEIVDTLELARIKYPGSQHSLDALCKRFKIDNSKREKHNALLDCELLRDVYINLLGQKEPTFNFLSENVINKNTENVDERKKIYSKIKIIPTEDELKKHESFLKSNFRKNFF